MPRATPRPALNRAGIVAVAVTLADEEGADALSMRRVADALGVVPMALYRHVADKEDLLDGLVDSVIGEFAAPAGHAETTGDWRVPVRAAAFDARQVVARHPWARRAIETRTQRTPAVLAHMERLTQLFLDGGLSPDLTHHAMHVLGNRIWGFSPELFNDPGHQAVRRPSLGPVPDPDDYPGILAIAADARGRRPDAVGCDETFEFGFALDLILDGVHRLHESGWVSPTS
ncbi:MAG: TetR/AcrR family transcriptional regulator [Phycicoccus sp.]|nr:TetR/AcrR family transcriptional regulator [Phycicoccus sp.]